MKTIHITFPPSENYIWHMEHTAPNRNFIVGDWKFEFNSNAKNIDAWVVWQSHAGIEHTETRFCPPNKTVLVLREPPEIIELPPDYLRQFALIISPDKRMAWHTGHQYQQFGQNWHIEKDCEELLSMDGPPKKSESLSAVISSKSGTSGQNLRRDLAKAIKNDFGDQFHWFGRGVNPIKEKWDSVAPYKYHLVGENGRYPHYWTEKLCDAFLGWCLPFYVGDPEIHQYFPSESLIVLDSANPQKCIEKIRTAIDENAWEKALPFIAEARTKILNEYNFFNTILRLLENQSEMEPAQTTLVPSRTFRFPIQTRIGWRIRNWRKKIASVIGK